MVDVNALTSHHGDIRLIGAQYHHMVDLIQVIQVHSQDLEETQQLTQDLRAAAAVATIHLLHFNQETLLETHFVQTETPVL